MKQLNALIDEIFQALSRMARYGTRQISRMSPPALLGAALVLAFICSVLPLALVLFALFMLVKLAVGASVICHRRNAAPPREHAE